VCLIQHYTGSNNSDNKAWALALGPDFMALALVVQDLGLGIYGLGLGDSDLANWIVSISLCVSGLDSGYLVLSQTLMLMDVNSSNYYY
jgi:hypothetical protein